ncbi:MAG: hypothetical protein CVV64_01220 [Candidatus Wallbacteria bacterium HGW-Wallbacteria-1]|jgi:hypothetical protein|uniref:DUF721 domain-containing protein n=1 Tax=Candidatus Wallbacteria bacterium HGW-Wallbacteria-1 TaxID=2013854 RepID=A0A2N1PUS5_9BACT|nr:MAG: hypothetical protein CVV64_01220 [Candidatus Wallbacteria bacterium HGW-Wallbacteria-1]
MAERKKGKFHGPVPLSGAMPRVTVKNRTSIPGKALQDAWVAYFGNFAAYAMPVGISDGVLDIVVESSAALMGIRGLYKKILGCFSRVFGQEVVSRIRFKVDPAALEALRPLRNIGLSDESVEGRTEPPEDAVLTAEMEKNLSGNPELLAAFGEFYRKCSQVQHRLTAGGWKPCRECKVLTPSTYCPACMEEHRQKALREADALISKCPWVSFEEVAGRVSELTIVDFIALRERKADQARTRMMDLMFKVANQMTRDNISALTAAASDYILLSRGVDPAALTPDLMLECLPKEVCRILALSRR